MHAVDADQQNVVDRSIAQNRRLGLGARLDALGQQADQQAAAPTPAKGL